MFCFCFYALHQFFTLTLLFLLVRAKKYSLPRGAGYPSYATAPTPEIKL